MGQTCQDDTRTELSRPGEHGLTTRIVEKGIQQHILHMLMDKSLVEMYKHIIVYVLETAINKVEQGVFLLDLLR